MTIDRRSILAGMASACMGVHARAAGVSLRIEVQLPSDRDQTGVLVLKRDGQRIAGPFDAYGRSDSGTASAHHNSRRDPTKEYGDTPSGSYAVPRSTATGDGTAYNHHSYGPNGALVLQATAGQALEAAGNGRIGLLIHGGEPGDGGRLRATHGCLRLSNASMAALMSAIASAGENATFDRCEVTQIDASIGPPGDPVCGEDAGDPPPGIDALLNPGPIIP